jgi:hypothetical protein
VLHGKSGAGRERVSDVAHIVWHGSRVALT